MKRDFVIPLFFIIFKQMDRIKVLIIGETCTDEFVYCEVNRLSPEAPVPVLNPLSITKNKGMAGNTKENVKSLVDNPNIILVTQSETITKTRYVENKSNHMFLRVDKGEDSITPIELNEDILESIKWSDIVIVSDYNKGFMSDQDIKTIGELSKLSILDSKRRLTTDMVNGYTFIKLNELEYTNNVDLKHDGLIITLGSKGAKYKDKIYPSSNPQETIDVSGAGDTFTSSFITSYYSKSDIDFAINTANKKASEVVSKRGVVIAK